MRQYEPHQPTLADMTHVDRLEHMYSLQTELQVMFANGTHPAQLPAHVQMNYIRTMVLSLEDELHEALAETGWKPWAASNHINTEAFKGELVDAFHFFMNLMMVTNMTMEELYERYLRKREVNIRRQEEGYDGVSTKCPACKRAYDDTGVLCHPENNDMSTVGPHGPAYCDKLRTFIEPKPTPDCGDPNCPHAPDGGNHPVVAK